MNKRPWNTLKKYAIIATAGTILASVGGTSTYSKVEASSLNIAQQVNQFTDVSSSHWAGDSINWAVSKGLVKGYGNGMFKPDNKLTEAELASILLSFYPGLGDSSKNTSQVKHWSDAVYSALDNRGVPFKGYKSKAVRDQEVSRGMLALVVANSQGYNYDLDESVKYMFQEKLSAGVNTAGKTIHDIYGTQQGLTRAQAVAFFQRLHDQGKTVVKELQQTPKSYTSPNTSESEWIRYEDLPANQKPIIIYGKEIQGDIVIEKEPLFP